MGGANLNYWPKDWFLRSYVPHKNNNPIRAFREWMIWYALVGVIGYNYIYRWEMTHVRTYRVPRKANFVQAHQLHLDEDDPTYFTKYKTGKKVFTY